jgi:hypothetical protein
LLKGCVAWTYLETCDERKIEMGAVRVSSVATECFKSAIRMRCIESDEAMHAALSMRGAAKWLRSAMSCHSIAPLIDGSGPLVDGSAPLIDRIALLMTYIAMSKRGLPEVLVPSRKSSVAADAP